MNTANYPPAVLTKAFTWAYEELGLSAKDAAELLGINETGLKQTALVGFPDDAPQTSLQLAFIRFYYQLITTFSGDTDHMRSWFHSYDARLEGSPRMMCTSEEGITRLVESLTLIEPAAYRSPANDVHPSPRKEVG